MAMTISVTAATLGLKRGQDSPKAFTPLRQAAGARISQHSRLTARASAVDASKVLPQADRVLVRLEELPEASAGGVLLPKPAVKFERYLIGEVLSAGKEAANVEKGQKVMFSDINAYEVNMGTSDKLCFCKAGDLLAVLD